MAILGRSKGTGCLKSLRHCNERIIVQWCKKRGQRTSHLTMRVGHKMQPQSGAIPICWVSSFAMFQTQNSGQHLGPVGGYSFVDLETWPCQELRGLQEEVYDESSNVHIWKIRAKTGTTQVKKSGGSKQLGNIKSSVKSFRKLMTNVWTPLNRYFCSTNRMIDKI